MGIGYWVLDVMCEWTGRFRTFSQTPTLSLIKVYLSEDGEDKRTTNSKEMEEANDMMPM